MSDSDSDSGPVTVKLVTGNISATPLSRPSPPRIIRVSVNCFGACSIPSLFHAYSWLRRSTKHCWQNYIDYHKCIQARGDDFPACKQFWRAYHSLCPNEWISKWDTQREEGINPSNFNL
ncbi:cytochrome c oxidase, subunit VIb [Jimgerdemannia flammicorona]|uniref:Cytochrome c oxidase, subunit VIb n=1 Tax=Jimgerdemannia flammicorona TaxID=994334 RepID=A0A433QEI8_9FUNG|nr:cytochrome c oxidase, subunit VIb [Jimgerdemannia flammicorona]